MMRALKIAATGMSAQQMNVDVLSNNIANINTTGFKRQRAAFRDLIYQDQIVAGSATSAAGNISPAGVQTGLGVNIGSTYDIHEQGPLQRTESSLDFAISGRGFFEITLPDGTAAYTRDGSFQVDNTGTIVNIDGFELNPGIVVPEDAVNLTVTSAGIVSAQVGDDILELGQIQLSMFQNEAGLRNIGDNLFKETEASGVANATNPTENGSGQIEQFFVEASNVDSIEEVTNLITAQRSFELNSRVITTVDEMLNAINQIR